VEEEEDGLSGAGLDLRVEVGKLDICDSQQDCTPRPELVAIYEKILSQDKVDGKVTVGTLFKIRFALQKHFRDQGQFLSRVILERQQLHSDRPVKYKLYEGLIGQVIVNAGADVGPVKSLIQRMGDRLVTNRPATLSEVERQLLLIQDIPGISARARFAASPSQEGAAVLTIDVVRTPYAGFASIDNRGAGFAGPWQGTLGISANSFTSLGDRTSVYLFSTPDSEQRFGQLAFSTILTSDGLSLSVQGGHGPSYPGGLLGEAGFASDVTMAGLQLTMPMLRSRRSNVWLSSGMAMNNSHIKLKQDAGAYERITKSHVRTVSLGLSASHLDGLIDPEWPGFNEFSLGIDQGLQGVGATGRNDPLTARPDSRPDFTRITGRLSRRQALTPTGGNEGTWAWDLRLAIAGQYGVGVLPPSQKSQLGGLEFGRGYYYGLLSGDRAVSGSVEVTARRPLNEWFADASIAPYIFYDHGMVWNLANGDPGRRFLHSVGGGLRFDLSRHVSVEAEYARRLVTNPSRTNENPLNPSRVFGRLVVRY
jgi:hemolysin activation/secretion protein